MVPLTHHTLIFFFSTTAASAGYSSLQLKPGEEKSVRKRKKDDVTSLCTKTHQLAANELPKKNLELGFFCFLLPGS